MIVKPPSVAGYGRSDNDVPFPSPLPPSVALPPSLPSDEEGSRLVRTRGVEPEEQSSGGEVGERRGTTTWELDLTSMNSRISVPEDDIVTKVTRVSKSDLGSRRRTRARPRSRSRSRPDGVTRSVTVRTRKREKISAPNKGNLSGRLTVVSSVRCRDFFFFFPSVIFLVGLGAVMHRVRIET